MEESVAGREDISDGHVVCGAKRAGLGRGDEVIIPVVLDHVEIITLGDNDLVARKGDCSEWVVRTFSEETRIERPHR